MAFTNRKEPLDISVLIATRDRCQLLEMTINHLIHQSLKNIRWEIIVIDNGSTDNTIHTLARAQTQLPLTVLQEPIPGKNGALNKALNIVRGDLLVFTDDDIEPSSQWLADLFSASRRWPTYSIFCGPVFPTYPEETPAWLREHKFAAPAFAEFVIAAQEGPLHSSITPFGPNYAIRANRLKDLRFCTQIGPCGKNYPMGGETELLRRLVARGERIIYVPSASVKHYIGPHQIKLEWLIQRAFNFGRGTARLHFDRDPKTIQARIMELEKSLADEPANPSQNVSEAERDRFERETMIHFLRGQLFEYQALTIEAGGGRK